MLVMTYTVTRTNAAESQEVQATDHLRALAAAVIDTNVPATQPDIDSRTLRADDGERIVVVGPKGYTSPGTPGPTLAKTYIMRQVPVMVPEAE
jgi:hypothetical protein